jgi:cysteine synthase
MILAATLKHTRWSPNYFDNFSNKQKKNSGTFDFIFPKLNKRIRYYHASLGTMVD